VTDNGEIRVGVIGLGFGAVHARVLSEMDGVSLAAVCDRDKTRLAAVIRGRTAHRYTDYREMFRSERLDAAIVAVPTRLHEEVALAAIDAGAAVLVEKPLAATLAEGYRLAEAAAKAGIPLMAGHIERFSPAIVETRRRVTAGDVGRILQLASRRLGPFAARTRDVGVIHDLAYHDIDVMRFILAAEVERVYAETQTAVRTEFEDGVIGQMRFEAFNGQPGPIGLVQVNWLTPRKMRDLSVLGERGLLIADYADYLAPTIEIHGSEPAEWAGLTGRTWTMLANLRGRDLGPVVRIPVEPREPLEQELLAFTEAVRSGSEPPVTARDALATLAVADAMAQSARSGKAVMPERV
jgi:UDP-N-acetylglucosamine 3-dehydrogenase